MKHHIIGTAGHVDHGKTALIRALTGMDADRLEEEKRRGITIDLGFAWLDLPDGGRAGIVDVPGHEKFVKNMLAGAGGMELALLAVAADEGFMPQTREHLDILSLLDIPGGIIVVTKADLVDADWLELVREEIREEVRGSFLEAAPMVSVSSETGEGISGLKETIFRLLSESGENREGLPFRMPVDRVFSAEGFGTVVTGTITGGSLKEGAEVELYPGDLTAKVRGIQVHGVRVDTAFAGQRAAVNLAGVKRDSVSRGCDLAMPGALRPSMMLDVKLKCLPGARELKNGSRLHFHHGAGVSVCKLVLLDREVLLPGEEGYAQLRFTESVFLRNGDRFVVRFFSPVETVGGGAVLNSCPRRHKRFRAEVLEGLKVLDGGTEQEKLLRCFRELGPDPADPEDLYGQTDLPRQEFEEMLTRLIAEEKLISLGERAVLHRDHLDALGERLTALLADFHNREPMQPGMKREELRSRLTPRWETGPANRALDILSRRGLAEEENQRFRLPGFRAAFTPAQERLMEAIEADFLRSGLTFSCTADGVKEKYAGKKELKGALDALFQSGRLTALSPQTALHESLYREVWKQLEDFCRENGGITLGQFRDLTGTSRKYALLILESFDRKGLTRKTGEMRILTE